MDEEKDRTNEFFLALLPLVLSVMLLTLPLLWIPDWVRFADYGKEAIATVVEYKFEIGKKGVTHHYHQLEYNNYSCKKGLDRKYPNGTQFYILYLPENPQNIILGRATDSFLDIIKREFGVAGVILIIFSILSFWYGYRILRRLYTCKPTDQPTANK